MAIFLEEKYTRPDKIDFINAVKDVASQCNIEPDWLMALMYHESGFDPYITSQFSPFCFGLFQFHPSYHNVAALKLMTPAQQVYYWRDKYGLPFRLKFKSFYDVCCANFYPAAMGKPDSYVFPVEVYLANKIFDTNLDGQITMAEYKAYLRKRYPSLFSVSYQTKKNVLPIFIIAAILGILILFLFNNKKLLFDKYNV